MANYYWVGGSATWDATAGSKWSSSSGGAASYLIAPTILDDVYFTAASGTVNVVFASGINCRSLNFTGFTGSFTGASAANTVNIYGGLTMGTGMTVPAATNTFTFAATTTNAGAGHPITTNGKTLPNVTFNGVGGKWILQDALTCGVFTVTAGNFDTGNHDMSVSRFISSNSNVRTISLGSSLITIATDADLASTGNLTWSTNTATMRLQAMSAGSPFDYKGLSLEYPAVYSFGSSLFGAGTFKDLTVTGSAITNGFLNLNNNTVFTGTVSITGNSSTNRLLVQSNTLGTPRVITAAAVSLTDVDFMDISIVGPVGSTITSDSFNRADGPLDTTDAAAGGSALAWTANNGTWSVDSNKAASTSTGLVYRSATVDAGVTDMAVEAVITPGSQIWGLNARFTDQNNRIFIQHNGTQFAIGQIKDGTQTTILTTNISFSAGDKVCVAVVGNGVAAYKNDVCIGSALITYTLTGTRAGLTTYGTDLVRRFDDFKVLNAPNVTGTRLGDCLGNSGIEFTTASGTPRDGGGPGVKRYAVAPGNFSSTAMWSETSGGSPGASVPLPQDDVYLDANSAAGTYTPDMARMCRNLDCTGFTRTLSTGVRATVISGNVTLGSGMTFNTGGGGGIELTHAASGTITTNGATVGHGIALFGSNYSLADDYNGNITYGLSVGNGSTFTSNNHTMTLRSLSSGSGATAKTINLGTSTLNLLGTTAGAENLFYMHPGAAVLTGTPTLNIVNATANDRSITCPQAAAITYLVADSPGALILSGSSTIGTLNIGSGRSLKLTSGTTQKIGTLNLAGVPRGGVRLPGVGGTYLSTPDSAAVSVTGDIDIRCRVALADYTAASEGALVAKYGAAGQRSFRFFVDTVGRLNLNMSTDGTANAGFQWTAGPTFVDGTAYWVRTTRTAAGTLRFFYAADQPTMPTSWTEAGVSQTLSAGQNIYDSTGPVEVGSMTLGTAYLANGVFYRAQIRNNVLDDGSGIVFDTDFSPARFWPFFLDSANGAAVTPSTTLANVGDGRVVIESSTAGTGATLEVGSTTGMNYVDLRDVTMNGSDTYIEATSVIRSNVKGVRRGPKTGMSMMMGV